MQEPEVGQPHPETNRQGHNLTPHKQGGKQEIETQIQANPNTPPLCKDDDTTP